MGKQITMNEKRAERLLWKMEEGKFKASTYIDRKVLGSFKTTFEVNPINGETTVEVHSLSYEKLKLERTSCIGLKTAINAVNGFFEEIDELIENVSLNAKERAINAYKREIAAAMKLN